jgi:hypothetical protein
MKKKELKKLTKSLYLQINNHEVVSADRFYNWINEKRQEKISQLLD